MKKFLKLFVLTLVITIVAGTTFAAAQDNKVEISFYVGDETLMINGTAITVEKPYVVGEGVTLVPLRVITEAFGAVVDWEDSTKTITLTYPDVSIILQIGNSIAEVNGKAETLLAAPELPTEYTMVPLRFISETFGAVVSYEDATGKITVVKDSNQIGSTVEGAINNAKIGDSYYKWSMENPKNMQMAERSFDGTLTAFESESGEFYVAIYPLEKDYDFEKDFVDTKNSLQGTTLTKADKNTNNPNKRIMHFQAKDKETLLNMRIFVSKNYMYVVRGIFDIDAPTEKDEAIRVMDTFDLAFGSGDIYDMSNVKDGFRTFKSEELKLSLNLPHNYYQTSNEDTINYFVFRPMDAQDNISDIVFAVYSKSEAGDAKTLAEQDYNNNKNSINEELSQFSETIYQKAYSDFSAYEYDRTIKHGTTEDYARDIFFEKGDYVYNICVTVKLPNADADIFIDSIVNSVKAEILDPNEVGILIRNIAEATGTYTATVENATMDVPNNYLISGNNPAYFLDPLNGIRMIFTKLTDRAYSYNLMWNWMKQTEDEYGKKFGNTIMQKTKEITLGEKRFANFVLKEDKEGTITYTELYGTYKNNAMYILQINYPELAYSETNRQSIQKILESLTLNL